MGKWITTKTGRHIYIDDKGKSFNKGSKDYNYYKSKELIIKILIIISMNFTIKDITNLL